MSVKITVNTFDVGRVPREKRTGFLESATRDETFDELMDRISRWVNDHAAPVRVVNVQAVYATTDAGTAAWTGRVLVFAENRTEA